VFIRGILHDWSHSLTVSSYKDKLLTDAKWSKKDAQFTPLTELLTSGIDYLTVHICDRNSPFCIGADMSECKYDKAQKHSYPAFGSDLDSAQSRAIGCDRFISRKLLLARDVHILPYIVLTPPVAEDPAICQGEHFREKPLSLQFTLRCPRLFLIRHHLTMHCPLPIEFHISLDAAKQHGATKREDCRICAPQTIATPSSAEHVAETTFPTAITKLRSKKNCSVARRVGAVLGSYYNCGLDVLLIPKRSLYFVVKQWTHCQNTL
jgi:hypothetical protein